MLSFGEKKEGKWRHEAIFPRFQTGWWLGFSKGSMTVASLCQRKGPLPYQMYGTLQMPHSKPFTMRFVWLLPLPNQITDIYPLSTQTGCAIDLVCLNWLRPHSKAYFRWLKVWIGCLLQLKTGALWETNANVCFSFFLQVWTWSKTNPNILQGCTSFADRFCERHCLMWKILLLMENYRKLIGM